MINLYNGDCLEILKSLAPNSVDSLVTDPPAGIGFMNAEWDKDKGGRHQWIHWLTQVMASAMAAMKPGAHGLVWALPRTSHWTATALEDAGFEVRDCVYHLFGSGFPKGQNISLYIDRHLGTPSRVVGQKASGLGTGREFGILQNGLNQQTSGLAPVYEPTSEEAKQWEGWNTALKPAAECWWLVRKPLDGTIANNLLAYGVGGLNVDACRIDTNDEIGRNNSGCHSHVGFMTSPGQNTIGLKDGRWPSHLLLTHSPKCRHYCVPECPVGIIGDEARYFYCSKPSMDEKESGLEDVPLTTWGEEAGRDDDKPHARCLTERRNAHPTVKSIRLMDYMIRLITPPGGTVLDPFMGSGTTGIAAVKGGWGFTGIEKHTPFYEIAQKRIMAAQAQLRLPL